MVLVFHEVREYKLVAVDSKDCDFPILVLLQVK